MSEFHGYKTRQHSAPAGCLLALFRWFFDLARFWIYIILFFALMAICSYGVVSYYVRGKELAAPDLTGLSLDEAASRLSGNAYKQYRLSISLDRRQPHSTAPKGAIISQKPEAQSRIKAGSPIKVVISDGPPLVTVPDLRGQSRDRALTLLRRYNLKLGTEARMPVPNKPGELVITTDPPGGSGVVEGSVVNLMLTAGSGQSNEMPDLGGFTLNEVHELLARRGLPDAQAVPRSMGGDAVPGQVVDQMPKAGQVVTPGTQIIVYVEPERAEPTPEPSPTPEEEPANVNDDGDVMPEPAATAKPAATPAAPKPQGGAIGESNADDEDSATPKAQPTAAPEASESTEDAPLPQ